MRGKPLGALGALAAVALWLEAPAQPPKPPALPPINPAAARLDATINGLDGPGFAVAADEDSRLLAAACENGTVLVWRRDVIAGLRVGDRTELVLAGHQGPVTALAWLPGYRLASGGADRKVVVWQLPEGSPIQTLNAAAPVRALAASPDGKRLASAEDAAVKLWDTASAKPGPKLEGPADWVHCLAFSPDGTRLAAGGYDGKLFVWEVATGKKLIEVPAGPPPAPNTEATRNVLHALAFSPDGKEIAAGGSDARVHVFGTADGKLLRSIQGHASSVCALAYHPGGAVLVSGSKDRTVRLWNPANGQALKSLEGHTAWVQGVVLLEKGTRLASVGADQTGRLWNLAPPAP